MYDEDDLYLVEEGMDVSWFVDTDAGIIYKAKDTEGGHSDIIGYTGFAEDKDSLGTSLFNSHFPSFDTLAGAHKHLSDFYESNIKALKKRLKITNKEFKRESEDIINSSEVIWSFNDICSGTHVSINKILIYKTATICVERTIITPDEVTVVKCFEEVISAIEYKSKKETMKDILSWEPIKRNPALKKAVKEEIKKS